MPRGWIGAPASSTLVPARAMSQLRLRSHAGEVVAVDVEPDMLAQIDVPNVRTVRRSGRGRRRVVGPLRPGYRGALVPLVRRRGDVAELPRLDRPACAARRLDHPERRAVAGGRDRHRAARRGAAAAAAEALPRGARELTVLECRGDRCWTERTWTAESLIGLAYSTSVASPERLGAKREEFERRVTRGVRRRRVPRPRQCECGARPPRRPLTRAVSAAKAARSARPRTPRRRIGSAYRRSSDRWSAAAANSRR